MYLGGRSNPLYVCVCVCLCAVHLAGGTTQPGRPGLQRLVYCCLLALSPHICGRSANAATDPLEPRSKSPEAGAAHTPLTRNLHTHARTQARTPTNLYVTYDTNVH